MNEEKYIQEKVGNRNPFRVPEGYFDHFADQVMATLPEREPRARRVWLRPLRYAAAAIILFHNHPSGDPSPSREDIHVTQRLVKSGTIMDIPVLDHIILGNNHFVSLKEKGMM